MFARLKDIAIGYRQRMAGLARAPEPDTALETASVTQAPVDGAAQSATVEICASEDVGEVIQRAREILDALPIQAA